VPQLSDVQVKKIKEEAGKVPIVKGEGHNVFAHTADIHALTISPDGKLPASGSEDTTIKLWSLPEGVQLTTLAGHAEAVLALAISPDGKLLASLGSRDNYSIELWSLPEGTFVRCLMDLAANPNEVKGNQFEFRMKKERRRHMPDHVVLQFHRMQFAYATAFREAGRRPLLRHHPQLLLAEAITGIRRKRSKQIEF
jgi:WD domain, G-beta repeat